MSKTSLQAPRGTRDFYPEDLRRRDWLFEHFRAVARAFAFEEVDAPVLELEELFTRKAGEEIVEQLYHFELHERRYALRPEMTPSIARMVMARAGSLRLPLRWFTITQNWRYERMTRGRKREHFQWNMDIWGEPGVAAEAELIAAAVQPAGPPRAAPRRRQGAPLLAGAAGGERARGHPRRCGRTSSPRSAWSSTSSRRSGADAVRELLVDPAGPVAIGGRRRPISWWPGSARAASSEAAAAAPPDSPAAASLRELFELLAAYGVADRVVFDASIVRGLAYYTGVVFEAFDAGRKLRAICGGGRYDGLLETLGGPRAAGRGLRLRRRRDPGAAGRPGPAARDPAPDRRGGGRARARRSARPRSGSRARCGRRGRRSSSCSGSRASSGRSPTPTSAGARRAYLVGPEEVAKGAALVRDLATGEQSERPLPGA